MPCNTGDQIHVINNDGGSSLNVYSRLQDTVVNVYDTALPRIIEIVSAGPPGASGPRGIAGPTGSHPPFFLIENTTPQRYATTASVAFWADISSSLYPVTGKSNFSLGSSTKPWSDVYSSGSIFIIKNTIPLITVNQSGIKFGNTNVIEYKSNTQQLLTIVSGSITGSAVNVDGVFMVGDFHYLPPVISGGIIKYNSNFYFGV